jgi:ankyrin repeat protein
VGAQCIHLAAKSGSIATLQLIISYGADTNARTDPHLHQSPLHFAAANPTFEACEVLLAHGADLMAQDAVRFDAWSCFSPLLYLLFRSSFLPSTQAGCTAVHLAAKCGRIDTIRFLARTNAGILVVNDFKGISPDLYSTSKYMSNQIRQVIEEFTNTSVAKVEVSDGAADSSWSLTYSNPRRSKFLR